MACGREERFGEGSSLWIICGCGLLTTYGADLITDSAEFLTKESENIGAQVRRGF